MEVGEGLHPGVRGRGTPCGEGTRSKVVHGTCFPICFHGCFEVFNQALLSTRQSRWAGEVFLCIGGSGKYPLSGAYVIRFKGGEVSLEVIECSVKLPVTTAVDLLSLEVSAELVVFFSSSFEQAKG